MRDAGLGRASDRIRAGCLERGSWTGAWLDGKSGPHPGHERYFNSFFGQPPPDLFRAGASSGNRDAVGSAKSIRPSQLATGGVWTGEDAGFILCAPRILSLHGKPSPC